MKLIREANNISLSLSFDHLGEFLPNLIYATIIYKQEAK